MDKRIIQIKNYIKNIDPKKIGFDNFDLNEVKIKEINRGGYNANYLVIINKKKFVFRLNIDKYLDVENQTKYEYNILKDLENKNIAPKVYFIDINKERTEENLLVEEFIENKELKFGVDFLKDAGKLVKKLHSVKVTQKNSLLKMNNPLDDQWKSIKKSIYFIKKGNYNPNFLNYINKFISKIDNYVEKNAKLFDKEKICINHKDLTIQNILQTNQGLRLVDWQSAMIDDPSFDLALFISDIAIEWHLGRTMTEKEKHIFLESYGANDDLLEKIKVRLPIISFELIVWGAKRAAYLRDKFKKGSIKKEDKDFFQKKIMLYENFLKEEKNIDKYLSFFNLYF